MYVCRYAFDLSHVFATNCHASVIYIYIMIDYIVIKKTNFFGDAFFFKEKFFIKSSYIF